VSIPTADSAIPSDAATRGATRRIRASRGWLPIDFVELWQYRELLYFLAWRDIKVRYKQTVLGVLWAAFQPLTAMVVFTIFFGNLAKMPSDGVPYPLFSYAGLLPWNLFATGINTASMSLVASAHLIRKVYFPRILLPVAGVAVGLVDFVIAFAILLAMIFAMGHTLTLNVLWLPPLLLLAIASSLGVGLWLAAINVYYRDVRYILPFFIQLLMFATPVVYPSSLLKQPWRTVYGLNPMVGVVEGFRWALLGTETSPSSTILVSSAVAALLLLSGAFVFRRMERSFAEMI